MHSSCGSVGLLRTGMGRWHLHSGTTVVDTSGLSCGSCWPGTFGRRTTSGYCCRSWMGMS